MKRSIVFGLVVLSVDVFASPLITQFPHDEGNSDTTPLRIIEQKIDVDDPKHRWTLVPDSEGKMHLIDLNPYETQIEPLFVAENDMKFILTTRLKTQEELKLDVTSIEASSFDKSHPTRFTMHGWNGDLTSGVNARVTEEYLKYGNFNCITIDWSSGAGTFDYIKARNRIYDAAEFSAKFIDFLHEHGFLQFETLHLIGHSLGGHAVGLVGKYVTRGKIQAIFALDPAGPLFSLDKPNERISSTDGVYVEVMHTNGWTLGFGKPLGHADFYPNFGRWQPGCGLDLTGSCSHARAPEYFAESINLNGFIAMRCKSFEELNKDKCTSVEETRHLMRPEPANLGLEGVFYLKTNSKSPYGTFLVP